MDNLNPFDPAYREPEPVDDVVREVAPSKRAGVVIHDSFEQGSERWLQARCGLLTASEMKLILTPTLKVANNDKERAHLYDLLAQRVTRYVEPMYVSDDMLRGTVDEITAKAVYVENYGEVTNMGFITNDKWGFTIGYSPDGLIGNDGLIECKSRRQYYQLQTILENKVPSEFIIQCQTGLLVSERRWLDFVSYCAGMPMVTLRVFPDPVCQEAIVNCAGQFYSKLEVKLAEYNARLAAEGGRYIPTERKEPNTGEIEL